MSNDTQVKQEAFWRVRSSLDPEGKWSAGEVSNLSALFFSGWHAATNYYHRGEFPMDDVSRLALEANNNTTTLQKGQVVHVDGIPYELLDDVTAFSATTASASKKEGMNG